MSDILEQLYNHCDPLTPAQPKDYTDLSEVRGGDTFIHTFCEELKRSRSRVHTLFTGHSGCGKSSELKKLESELDTDAPQHSHSRYFPVYIDAAEYVDIFDASTEEILLAVVTEIAAQFREKAQIELKNTTLANLMSGVVEIARSVKPSKATLDLKLIKLELGLNRADPSIRKKVREHLIPRTTTLLDEINALFIEARTRLREKTDANGNQVYHDFILILDNLEKIQTLGGRAQGEASYRALFIEGGQQFIRLNCHAIFTVPLSLARAAGKELMQLYGNEPIVLSNVKVEERGSYKRWDAGRNALRALLAERCHPYTVEQCMDKDALDELLTYSGGHVRQFLNFVRRSTLYTDAAPIPLDAMQRAISQAVPSYSVGVADATWEMLAALELSDDQEWDTSDETKRDLMEGLFVLEYVNGDRKQNFLNKSMPWYAVHPIVRALNPFQDAVKVLRKVSPA